MEVIQNDSNVIFLFTQVTMTNKPYMDICAMNAFESLNQVFTSLLPIWVHVSATNPFILEDDEFDFALRIVLS